MNCAAYSPLNLLMPPNPSNSKSALSRQMQHLRQQVDRIDSRILQLLQQRTKLSTRIGETKRRHRAVIYVPERERQLLARVSRLSKGKLPPRAAASIYREILSSSRAAQGQAPIGLLLASAAAVLPSARWCFGACDEFVSKKTWTELASGLTSGSLTLALLTGGDLARVLQSPKVRRDFLARFAVVGDFFPFLEPKVPLTRRIFMITPRMQGIAGEADRLLILIECKSTVNAVKSLLCAMPDRPIFVENVTLHASSTRYGTAALVRLVLPRLLDGAWVTGRMSAENAAVGLAVSLLGVYPGTENGG